MAVINVYPPLAPGLETRLAAVVMAARGNPGYFEAEECPYPPDLRGFLKKIVIETRIEDRARAQAEAQKPEVDPDEDKFDAMLRETERTIDQMDLSRLIWRKGMLRIVFSMSKHVQL